VSAAGPQDPMTVYILLIIAIHLNVKNGKAWPSIETLAKEARVSERTVQKHVRLGILGGWINRFFRKDAHGNLSNVYEAAIPKDFWPDTPISPKERIERLLPEHHDARERYKPNLPA